jgi:hypothetical protein
MALYAYTDNISMLYIAHGINDRIPNHFPLDTLLKHGFADNYFRRYAYHYIDSLKQSIPISPHQKN